MYLRIVHGRFDPAKYEDTVGVQSEINRAVQQLAGFQHIYSGFDRNAGKVCIASVGYGGAGTIFA